LIPAFRLPDNSKYRHSPAASTARGLLQGPRDDYAAIANLGAYCQFYSRERLHQSLGYRMPEAVYRGLVASHTRSSMERLS